MKATSEYLNRPLRTQTQAFQDIYASIKDARRVGNFERAADLWRMLDDMLHGSGFQPEMCDRRRRQNIERAAIRAGLLKDDAA